MNFGFDRGHSLSCTLVLKTCVVTGLYGGMGFAFIREEGMPPLCVCVDKVFAEDFGLVICKHFTSRIPSTSLVFLLRFIVLRCSRPDCLQSCLSQA